MGQFGPNYPKCGRLWTNNVPRSDQVLPNAPKCGRLWPNNLLESSKFRNRRHVAGSGQHICRDHVTFRHRKNSVEFGSHLDPMLPPPPEANQNMAELCQIRFAQLLPKRTKFKTSSQEHGHKIQCCLRCHCNLGRCWGPTFKSILMISATGGRNKWPRYLTECRQQGSLQGSGTGRCPSRSRWRLRHGHRSKGPNARHRSKHEIPRACEQW